MEIHNFQLSQYFLCVFSIWFLAITQVFQLFFIFTPKVTIQPSNTNWLHCSFVCSNSFISCCVNVRYRYDRIFNWIILVIHFVHRWHCKRNVLLEIGWNSEYWDGTENKGEFLQYGAALCGCETVEFRMFFEQFNRSTTSVRFKFIEKFNDCYEFFVFNFTTWGLLSICSTLLAGKSIFGSSVKYQNKALDFYMYL